MESGQDNVSTPEDIAETNELESLRYLIEELEKMIKNCACHLDLLKKIDEFKKF